MLYIYFQAFEPSELAAIEDASDGVDARARSGLLPETCYHATSGKGGGLKRTKFFFGARYLWTREQLAEGLAARVAGGVRVDVPPPPPWMKVRRGGGCGRGGGGGGGGGGQGRRRRCTLCESA